MWVLYRNPHNHHVHIDKYVYGVVEDKDILAFQKKLAETLKKTPDELVLGATYLQPLVGNYFARYYVPMTQYTGMPVPPEQPAVETMPVSQFHGVVRPSPCSTGQ
jgi:hypothetical protein